MGAVTPRPVGAPSPRHRATLAEWAKLEVSGTVLATYRVSRISVYWRSFGFITVFWVCVFGFFF